MEGTKPQWLKIRPSKNLKFKHLREKMRGSKLHTVCEEAHCPNMSECWSSGIATFMVMGDVCTRACRFCAVKKSANPPSLNPNEPKELAEAVKEFGLKYVVITSVDRDDLEDQGAGHIADCIKEVKESNSGVLVEVLIPDFQGKEDLLEIVIDAKPDVLGHNIETVKELQGIARDRRANYEQSLSVLKNAKKLGKGIYTKSSIMVGLGETKEQVVSAMDDLREVGVDIITIGQYLQPGEKNIALAEYIAPGQFEEYEKIAKEKDFAYVASGPFVRSSYKAGELFMEQKIRGVK